MYMCLCTMYLCEASRMAKHKIVDSLFDELVPCSFQDTSSVQQWHCYNFGCDYMEIGRMAGQMFGLKRLKSDYISHWWHYWSLLLL